MASKYAGLKGRIPEQQTPRNANLIAELEKREKDPIASLTLAYLENRREAAGLATKVSALGVIEEALEILIRQRLEADEMDGVKIHGHSWSEKFEPYPVCEDPAKIIEYFKKHDADQLQLKSSELASRLKNLIKEEALAGELKIENEDVTDTVTGEVRSISIVRSSRVPGVRVFLKAGLNPPAKSK